MSGTSGQVWQPVRFARQEMKFQPQLLIIAVFQLTMVVPPTSVTRKKTIWLATAPMFAITEITATLMMRFLLIK